MKGQKLSEIISDNLGVPFLDAIIEHQSEHIRIELKKKYVEVKEKKNKGMQTIEYFECGKNEGI